MSSPRYAKAKGRQTETMVVDYLQKRGYVHAERRRLNGQHDRGDIAGIPGLTIEVKGGKTIDLPGWLRELDVEQTNTGDPTGLLVVRRRGSRDVGEWYAVQNLDAWLALYQQVDTDLAAGEAA